MLDLGQPQLELLPLPSGDKPELAGEPGDRRAGALAEADCVPPPPMSEPVDELARLFSGHLAALRKLVHEIVGSLLRERHGAEAREQSLLEKVFHRLPLGLTGSGHGASPGVACGVPRAEQQPIRHRWVPAAPRRPGPPPAREPAGRRGLRCPVQARPAPASPASPPACASRTRAPAP